MYNKLFTRILDSSVWLEPTHTRIVWLTFIAAMDEDGFARFASIANLARRAVLTEKETEDAVKTLEAPDPNSSDPDHEGRRIERVPGGWMVLNAPKYRELVTRAVIREQTRVRVAKHRANSQKTNALTKCNANVTPSEAVSVSKSVSKETNKSQKPPRSKPQEEAWRKLNHQSDHSKYDPNRDDVSGLSQKDYEDSLHQMQIGVESARTVPDEQ